jgi:drug/metabolite transporter (DMT)-like permease
MDRVAKVPAYVYVFALLSMVFWGMSFIWTSVVFEYYQPITTIFLRLVISCAFLFALLSATGYLQRIRREHILLFLASAIFNPFFYFIGENYGLKYSTPAVSAIMIATIPVVSPIMAWFMIREQVRLITVAGIIISFAGILVMLINPDLSLTARPEGILFLLFAVVSAVVYSVLLKKLTHTYTPINIIAWQNLIGVFLFLPVFLIMDLDAFLMVSPGPRLITALLSLAIFASSMAFVLFATAIKHLGVNRANVYGNLIPVITAIASYFLLQEIFTTKKIAGILIVLLGVIITQMTKRRK